MSQIISKTFRSHLGWRWIRQENQELRRIGLHWNKNLDNMPKCFFFFFEALYTWNCAAACRHVLCCADTTHCDDFKHFSRREIKFLFVSHVLGGWQNIVGLLAVCFYTLETLLWWYFPQFNLNKCILYFQCKGEYVGETLQQWLSTSMSDVANNANAHNS